MIGLGVPPYRQVRTAAKNGAFIVMMRLRRQVDVNAIFGEGDTPRAADAGGTSGSIAAPRGVSRDLLLGLAFARLFRLSIWRALSWVYACPHSGKDSKLSVQTLSANV